MWSYDKFNNRVNETGVSKAFIGRQIGKDQYFIRDHEKKGFTDEQIAIIAKCLWTTPEYLTDETDEKEIPSISEMLSREEKNLLKAWRAAENAKDFEVMDNTAWALRKYGMPMPKKNNTDQQSNSVVK